VSNCFAGVYEPNYEYAQNPHFSDCAFVSCYYGVYTESGANLEPAGGHRLAFDRVRVTDNIASGLVLGEPARLSSSLVARNGQDGIRVVSYDKHEWTYCANVSVLDNGRYGIYNHNGWANGIAFVNGVIAGHPTGCYRDSSGHSGGICLSYSILHNDSNYNKLYADNGRISVGAGVQEVEDVKFKSSSTHYAHPTLRSPCIGGGSSNPKYRLPGLSADYSFPYMPTVYLDGEPINYKRRVDCGCYGRGKVGAVVILR